jgi:hypothetical protein
MEQETKTPSQVLMDAMSLFSESEPVSLVVIFTNRDGELIIKSEETRTLALGLLEAAKHLVLNGSSDGDRK